MKQINYNVDVKHAGHVYEFNRTTGVTPEVWQQWFANRDNGWPVLKQQPKRLRLRLQGQVVVDREVGSRTMWTWFKNSRQMGPWREL